MFTESGAMVRLCLVEIPYECGGSGPKYHRPFMTRLYEADGRARQGDAGFGTTTLLYIPLGFYRLSNVAQIRL